MQISLYKKRTQLIVSLPQRGGGIVEGFTIEGWDDFVENFSKFVDKWADKKRVLLQRMANIYHGQVIPK